MIREYKTDLEEARERLAELLRQPESLATDIAKQQHEIADLATLADESEEADEILEMDLGCLTSACQAVLHSAGERGLTPDEVRQRLRTFHFPIDEYKSPLTSIHIVLKRLKKGGGSLE